MRDFLLRAATQAAMDSALLAAGIVAEVDFGTDVQLVPIDGVTIDRIGTINADSRYHANIRADLTPTQIAALPTFTPLPVTPYRVFFD